MSSTVYRSWEPLYQVLNYKIVLVKVQIKVPRGNCGGDEQLIFCESKKTNINERKMKWIKANNVGKLNSIYAWSETRTFGCTQEFKK